MSSSIVAACKRPKTFLHDNALATTNLCRYNLRVRWMVITCPAVSQMVSLTL